MRALSVNKCCPFQLLSEGVPLISSNLMSPAFSLLNIRSDIDRVHSLDAPVAAHEAGEAWPSGSLLSGASGSCKACTLHVQKSPGPLCLASWHHQQYQGKGKAKGSSRWMLKKWNNPPAPFFLGSYFKEEKRCLKKMKIKCKLT